MTAVVFCQRQGALFYLQNRPHLIKLDGAPCQRHANQEALPRTTSLEIPAKRGAGKMRSASERVRPVLIRR